MFHVEIRGIACIEIVHDFTKVCHGRFEYEMIVVTHEDIAMDNRLA